MLFQEDRSFAVSSSPPLLAVRLSGLVLLLSPAFDHCLASYQIIPWDKSTLYTPSQNGESSLADAFTPSVLGNVWTEQSLPPACSHVYPTQGDIHFTCRSRCPPYGRLTRHWVLLSCEGRVTGPLQGALSNAQIPFFPGFSGPS